MELIQYYDEAEERLLAKCIKCGKCVKKCKAMKHVESRENPKRIQESILGYLHGEKSLSPAAREKVSACMRCFGCYDVKCPAEISSMLINELTDRETESRKENPWEMDLYPVHDELARKGSSEKEYQRITTESTPDGAEVLFFPGCNVYKQPDKLLNALTIMDATGVPYAFAPGMTYCCGWSARGCTGDAVWLQAAGEKLMQFAEKLRIKKMVFWCPTCMCVLNDRIRRFYEPAFACMTFGQYMLENFEKLTFPEACPQRITYHEPCKTSYMGIDAGEANSVRKILKRIPGIELIEMEHHGEDTLCCGCDAVDNAFDVGHRATVARLAEAAATGADKMIDVCHNCHWIFKPAQKDAGDVEREIHIENYSTFLTKAMGKPRKDTLE